VIRHLDTILRCMGKYRYVFAGICIVLFLQQKPIPIHNSILSIIAGTVFCLHLISYRHILVNKISISSQAKWLVFIIPSTIYPAYLYQFFYLSPFVLITTFVTGIAILNLMDIVVREHLNDNTL